MTARLHHAAFMARLKSSGGIPEAFDGEVPSGLQRWAKVWPPAGWSSQFRMSGLRTAKTFTWTVHSVGISVEHALWVQERVLLKAENAQLVVAGWNPQKVTHPVSRVMDLDESGSVPLFFIVDQFDVYSEPKA